jgi:hypothetical protein
LGIFVASPGLVVPTATALGAMLLVRVFFDFEDEIVRINYDEGSLGYPPTNIRKIGLTVSRKGHD